MKVCNTIRKGTRCQFMKIDKCSFPDGFCSPIVDKCEGCKNIIDYDNVTYCKSYMKPESMWLSGRCPLCTVRIETPKEVMKKLNPIKASKLASKAKKEKIRVM